MKNIFIAGVPRAGKSTLSKMIKEEIPIYNQFSFEAIRNGFMETQPSLNMGNKNSNARKNILPKHIITFAHWNNILLSNPSLVEGSFCTIEELYNLTNGDDEIICLGLGGRTVDEIVKGIKENDTDDDYTKQWTNKQIKEHFYDISERDRENYEFCMKNNISYYDTYENREETFKEIIDKLSRQINKRR